VYTGEVVVFKALQGQITFSQSTQLACAVVLAHDGAAVGSSPAAAAASGAVDSSSAWAHRNALLCCVVAAACAAPWRPLHAQVCANLPTPQVAQVALTTREGVGDGSARMSLQKRLTTPEIDVQQRAAAALCVFACSRSSSVASDALTASSALSAAQSELSFTPSGDIWIELNVSALQVPHSLTCRAR
jgi:hypothetical protein